MFEKELEQEERRRWPRSEGVARATRPASSAGRGGPSPGRRRGRSLGGSPCAEAGPPLTAASVLSRPRPMRGESPRSTTPSWTKSRFPEEPFEEVRRPCSGGHGQEQRAAAGQARGVAAAGDDARAAVVDPRHLAAERPAGGRFRRPGRPFQAHALRLEEEVRRVGPGRADGPARAAAPRAAACTS